MKKFAKVMALLVFLLSFMVFMTACVEIDEALPYYKQVQQK